MHVKVDENLCQGTGYCERIAPEVFELRGEVSQVVMVEPGAELAEKVQEAEDLCPARAISQ